LRASDEKPNCKTRRLGDRHHGRLILSIVMFAALADVAIKKTEMEK
jgi:hypothetical protein